MMMMMMMYLSGVVNVGVNNLEAVISSCVNLHTVYTKEACSCRLAVLPTWCFNGHYLNYYNYHYWVVILEYPSSWLLCFKEVCVSLKIKLFLPIAFPTTLLT